MDKFVPINPTPNFVTAVYAPDTLRNPKHQPGKLVYSAQFDAEKLKCLSMVLLFPWICALDGIADQTSLDVYTNGIMFTRPDSCGMDCWMPTQRQAAGGFRYFDHQAFDLPATTGRLLPTSCCAIPAILGFLGKFGDQVNLTSKLLNTCKPSGMGHITTGCFILCLNESVHGLKDGEGARLAGVINEQVRMFRENPTNYGMDPVAASGGAKMV